MGSIILAYVVQACKGIGYWFHRKCCEMKGTVTFEQLAE